MIFLINAIGVQNKDMVADSQGIYKGKKLFPFLQVENSGAKPRSVPNLCSAAVRGWSLIEKLFCWGVTFFGKAYMNGYGDINDY